MSAQKTDNITASGIPEIPSIAKEFLQIMAQPLSEASINSLLDKYPLFFQRLLKVINSGHINVTTKVSNIFQAAELLGTEKICQLLIVQVVYRALDQYKVRGVELEPFWQDSLRRAVSARKVGELIGLDANSCFTAGFMQDVGFLLLFLQQPDKGPLWYEFRKREPEARLSMEMNMFGVGHTEQLERLLNEWHVLPGMHAPLCAHHKPEDVPLNELDMQLSKVLRCADWMSAVYTADDKSYVINHCRKILSDDFEMEPYRAEELLASIPDEVNTAAGVLGITVKEHTPFSQILFAANIRLNEDNVNFQELTLRLEQALDERDQLAAEINRELNLAREIQRSLLPACQGDGYPVNGINVSAKILSGDFYDFFELENGDIYFNLGDVSGKGVNAALLMAKTSSLFRCLGKRINDPGKLLYEINNELCETSVHGMFVTMVAGLYMVREDKIKLVNAGNPPALLFTETGLCRELEASAPPLGIMQNTLYTEYDIDLNQGSLYIYSDGVTEGYIGDESELEIGGLFKMITQMDKSLAPNQRLQKIVEKITSASQSLRDDVTLLLVEKPESYDKT